MEPRPRHTDPPPGLSTPYRDSQRTEVMSVWWTPEVWDIDDDQHGSSSRSEGGSQYRGLIYVDLASGWVRKATLEEHMTARAVVNDRSYPSIVYTVRHIEIRLTE